MSRAGSATPSFYVSDHDNNWPAVPRYIRLYINNLLKITFYHVSYRFKSNLTNVEKEKKIEKIK